MSTSIDNPEIQAIRQSVTNSYIELIRLIEERLSRLDASKLYEVPEPGEWSIMESLAHISEFMQYWADEIDKLVENPGQKFGRTKEDPDRIRAIEEHKEDVLDAARSSLARSYTRLDQELSTLKDSDLALKAVHPKFGEQTLAWFIQDFVTGHLTGHLEQMGRALAALEAR
ncbi:MAG: DinB family protein [Ktedonobacteraceae bacterium]|nr:DinB family protein [Ktedonobacteraceae bacterium]